MQNCRAPLRVLDEFCRVGEEGKVVLLLGKEWRAYVTE